jgi:hypothetical protein
MFQMGFRGDASDYTTGVFSPKTSGIKFDKTDGTPDTDAKIYNCHFVDLNQCIEMTGRNLDVFDCNFGGSLHGIKINLKAGHDCRGISVDRNRFHTMANGERNLEVGVDPYCIEFTTPIAFGNKITGNVIDGKSRGFYKGGLDRNKISDNLGYLMYGIPFYIIDNLSIFWSGWDISSNNFTGIQGTASESAMQYGIYGTNQIQNGKISDNVFTNTVKHGIYLESVFAIQVSENHITNPNRDASTNGSIYDGIHIANGSSAKVNSNFIRSTLSGGVGHRYAIFNNSTGSQFSLNFGFGQQILFFKDDKESLNRVQNDIEPNNLSSFLQGKVNEFETGFDSFIENDNSQKIIGGSIRTRRKIGTAGAESTDITIKGLLNGSFNELAKIFSFGGITIGSRTGNELLQNGVVNARLLYADAVRIIDSANNFSASKTLITDSLQNSKLVFKDADSRARKVAFEELIGLSIDANYTATFDTLIKLQVITANRTINLASTSLRVDRLKFWNQNTSAFNWSFSTNVKDLTGNTVTTLLNGKLYNIFRDGTNWVVEIVS